jgi:hypothetical protein
VGFCPFIAKELGCLNVTIDAEEKELERDDDRRCL